MSFAYNVVTPEGAALIAQATATNPIVFVGSLSSATAASSKEDLASKPKSFYDGKSGTIFSASAQGNEARIMMSFDNVGLQTSQVIKSACVLGKLEGQLDEEAVIVSALSDTDSQITIPDSTSPKITIKIPINITINAGDDIATVGAEYASLADLERFVSTHKAGNPFEGEGQDILGEKTFKNAIKSGVVWPDSWIYQDFDSNRFSIAPERTHLTGATSIGLYSEIWRNDQRVPLVSVEEEIFPDPVFFKKSGSLRLNVTEEGQDKSAYISLDTGYDTQGDPESSVYASAQRTTLKADKESRMVSKEYSRLISSGNLSEPLNNPPYAEVATRYNSSGNNAAVLLRVNRNGTEYGVNYAVYSGRPALYPAQSGADLGADDNNNKWDNVYANTFNGNLQGLIPTADRKDKPIGSIFLVFLKALTLVSSKNIGDCLTNDYEIKTGELRVDTNGVVTAIGVTEISEGTYKLLSNIKTLNTDETSVALVMRVS